MINLPFCKDKEEYIDIYNKINESEYVSDELSDFLMKKDKVKTKWCKAFMMENFTAGICTTSRIESKHRTLSSYLNSRSKLCTVLQTFKEIESNESKKFIEEEFAKDDEKVICNIIILKELTQFFGEYVMAKIKINISKALNYKVTKKGNCW